MVMARTTVLMIMSSKRLDSIKQVCYNVRCSDRGVSCEAIAATPLPRSVVEGDIMDDFTERILETQADIEAHGPYQVTVTCVCDRKITTVISKEDWLKSDALTEGRTRLLTRNTCPKCAPDEFGEDND